jgi:Uma2 family endonuclease
MMLDHLHFTRRAEHTMDMPAVERRWTRAEVLELIGHNPLSTPRYEVVDGELFVTPSPSGPHQIAVLLLASLLRSYVREVGIGEALISPFDVELEPGTTVGPDIFVVPPEEAQRLRRELPVRVLLLAVETISPGSRRGDRGRKRHLYQRTVPEYWIVDNALRHFEMWRPDDPQPTILSNCLEWRPAGAAVPFVLDLRSFFAEVFGEPA